jgi:hypothetical protein
MLATLTQDHISWVELVASKIQGKKIAIEIGSGIGKITEVLSNSCEMVYAVDPWVTTSGPDERTQQLDSTPFETFCINCWDARLKIIPVVGLSQVCIPWLDSRGVNPDLIYLDGSHQYEDFIEDIRLISESFPTATIIGDDYTWGYKTDRPITRGLTYAESIGYKKSIYAGTGLWQISR